MHQNVVYVTVVFVTVIYVTAIYVTVIFGIFLFNINRKFVDFVGIFLWRTLIFPPPHRPRSLMVDPFSCI